MTDPLNPAFDIYEIYESLDVGDSHIILRLEEEVDQFGDCDRYEIAGFASKLLEYLVERLDEALGKHVFFDGNQHTSSPDWIKYELMAYWKHGGHNKYIAWSIYEARHVILVGKHFIS